MGDIVDTLWRLPRDIISDGYDAALRALGDVLPMTVHEFPSGTECWSWIVPEKWTCHEAYLETLAGRRVFSYADHPLHVVSYSLPFEGVVSREELFGHLHVHSRLPDAIPFIFKYYERDWGLCCSQRTKESLRDESYRVVIRTDFSYGTLKVGEIVAPGEREETIILYARTCVIRACSTTTCRAWPCRSPSCASCSGGRSGATRIASSSCLKRSGRWLTSPATQISSPR